MFIIKNILFDIDGKLLLTIFEYLFVFTLMIFGRKNIVATCVIEITYLISILVFILFHYHEKYYCYKYNALNINLNMFIIKNNFV